MHVLVLCYTPTVMSSLESSSVVLPDKPPELHTFCFSKKDFVKKAVVKFRALSWFARIAVLHIVGPQPIST